MPAEVGAAGVGLLGNVIQGATAPGPTAGSNINLTREGASQFLADLMSGKGFGTVDPSLIQNYYKMASQLLSGSESRAMGGAGRQAGAQANAYGVTNPYAWIQHAQAGVSGQYADQSGELSKALLASQLNQAQENTRTRLNLIGLGANQSGVEGKFPNIYPQMPNFGSQGGNNGFFGGYNPIWQMYQNSLGGK